MKRSKHSLSHYRLGTQNMGALTPIACLEVLPGDSIRHQVGALIRTQPLLAPVMHPCEASVHSFFVPSRILWSSWEDFIPDMNTSLTLPTVTIASTDTGAKKLAQSLGIGSSLASGSIVVQSLPFRAYNLIYNEFYRDQDLTTKLPERTGDTGDLAADFDIRNVAWEKDYFTTCRANPQLGVGDEIVPIISGGASAPVMGLYTSVNTYNDTAVGGSSLYGGQNEPTPILASSLPNKKAVNRGGTGATELIVEGKDPGIGQARHNVRADLTGVSLGSMSINDWRKAMARQKYREHRNRYGHRYRDLLAFLGVRSSDARLQRPEYLGGGRQTIAFSEVLSTADAGTADVGSMAGHGIAAIRTRPYRRFFEEHGYIISLMFVRPRTMYPNAVPRTFLRRKPEDYWQRELEMMGEQLVTNFEVYGDASAPSGTFGYIPRFDDYRHHESSVYGEFRNTLNFWHMGRIFQSQPVLNSSFVVSDPTNRIYASLSTDQLYIMASHRIVARRLVSKRARS